MTKIVILTYMYYCNLASNLKGLRLLYMVLLKNFTLEMNYDFITLFYTVKFKKKGTVVFGNRHNSLRTTKIRIS